MSLDKRLEAMEKLVQQLRMENSVERIPVSKSAKELVDFCIDNEHNDYLLTRETTNPYKPEKPCPVL